MCQITKRMIINEIMERVATHYRRDIDTFSKKKINNKLMIRAFLVAQILYFK